MKSLKSEIKSFKAPPPSTPSLKKSAGGEIWRKNFDIRRADYNLPYEALLGFQRFLKVTIGRSPMKKIVWVVKDGGNFATYFPKQELRKTIDLTLAKIISDPAHIDAVHRRATKLNWDLFHEAEKVREINFTKLGSKQLLAIHERLYRVIHTSHMHAIATTWFLDSDGEDFSKYLTKFLQKRIKKLKIDLDLPTVFSVLTTPAKGSFSQKEEEESLRLLAEFRKNRKVRHWFMSHTTEELIHLMRDLPVVFRRKISEHYYKWLWLPYTYTGPAWEVDYFLEVWRGLLHEDVDAIEKLKERKSKQEKIQKQRKILIKTLKLSAYEKHLFDIAADIVWLKGFRKDTFFYAFYTLDLLLSEVARRSGLTLMQAKHLVPGDPGQNMRGSEVALALAGKDFSNITSGRIKFSILYAHNNRVEVLVGAKARKLLRGLKLEKEKIANVDRLTGTCACPGQASGVVKIINVPEDMPKMKSGDIMLSHTTFPALVPAMKKAAAIVTEDGGITCHAAIVARELQTPCVVGVKNILSVLKDGDRVEVEANKGIVRKIN